MKTRLFCFLIFIFPSLTCFAQEDSTNATLFQFFKNLSLDFSGGGYYIGKKISDPINIEVPSWIKDTRKINNATFNKTWREAEDNPLYHGAYYFGINCKYKIIKGVTIFGNILGEHRGFSYGTNASSNIIVFPQVKIAIDKSVPLFDKRLRFYGSSGNQINPRLYEGLTIYNLYQQGHDFHVSWGKFDLNYVQISDLINGIGLKIDDSYDVISSLEALKISKNWKTDIRGGFSYYPIFNTHFRRLYNLSAGFYNTSGTRIYLQASYRPNNDSTFHKEEMLASVLGIETKLSRKRIKIETVFEVRYYGAGFNQGFKNTNVYYRKTGKANYANSIGDQFYPLMLYDRPFSQWAVFSEYQNASTYKNVAALTWRTNGRWFLYDKFQLRTNLDFNYIFAENEKPFLYPFYTLGAGWEPIDGNYLMVGITNKGMNLDIHYPTFYLHQKPSFILMIKRDLPLKWWEGFR